MERPPFIAAVCGVAIAMIVCISGCLAPSEPVADDSGVLWPARTAPDVVHAPLKVDIGLDRVATPGEVIWLPGQASGGTMPYTFTWTAPSVAPGCTKPLICGGTGPAACVTVHGTCRLRLAVTDATGETVASEIGITVPQ